VDVFLCVNELHVHVSSSGVRVRSSGHITVFELQQNAFKRFVFVFVFCVCVCVCVCLFLVSVVIFFCL
jgi:hypothetical protein